MAAHPAKTGHGSHKSGGMMTGHKKGMREAFTTGTKGDTTDVGAGKQRPAKGPVGDVKVPKDTGRKKRKVKVTFNSPKTTKITYG